MLERLRDRPFVVVAAAGLIVFVSMGLRQSYGIFMQPLGAALGIEREVFGLAIALQNLVFGLPLAGYLSDRYSARHVIAIGGLVYILAMYLMSLASGAGMLLLVLGLVTGLAQSATTFVVVLGAVARVVPAQHRGSAFGIVSALASLGLFAMVPLAQHFLLVGGWNWAFEGLAWMAAVILFGALFMPGKVRHADAQDVLGLWALLNRARTHSGYVLLVSGFFVCGFHVAFIATHLPAYVVDKGLSQSTGANALAMIGLFNVFGTLLFGWLADRLRKKLVLSWLYALRAVVISGFLFFPVTETTALVFGALIGLIWLATVPITSGLVSQMFGSRYLGTLYGVVFLGHQCGAFLGAWWAGRMFDSTGSYAAVWWTAVALGVMAALMHLFIRDHRVALSGAVASAA